MHGSPLEEEWLFSQFLSSILFALVGCFFSSGIKSRGRWFSSHFVFGLQNSTSATARVTQRLKDPLKNLTSASDGEGAARPTPDGCFLLKTLATRDRLRAWIGARMPPFAELPCFSSLQNEAKLLLLLHRSETTDGVWRYTCSRHKTQRRRIRGGEEEECWLRGWGIALSRELEGERWRKVSPEQGGRLRGRRGRAERRASAPGRRGQSWLESGGGGPEGPLAERGWGDAGGRWGRAGRLRGERVSGRRGRGAGAGCRCRWRCRRGVPPAGVGTFRAGALGGAGRRRQCALGAHGGGGAAAGAGPRGGAAAGSRGDWHVPG